MTDRRKVLPWPELERHEHLSTRVFRVDESICRSPHAPDGASDSDSSHSFWRLHCPDWVNIVPVTPDDQLVLIRQYRHGSRSITLEVPGGMVDPGEDAATAAARECQEETGYRCGPVQSLGTLAPNPALFPNTLYTYWATTEVEPGEIENDAGTEYTAVELMPLADLPSALLDGRIDHALVVATLWRFLHQYRR